MWRPACLLACVMALLAPPAVVCATATTSPVADAPSGIDDERHALADGVKATLDNDGRRGLEILKIVIAAPAFAQLTSDEQHTALFSAALDSLDVDDPQTSEDLLKRASVMPEAQGIDWHERLVASYNNADLADAALSFETIAQRWPATVIKVTDRAIFRMVDGVRKLKDGKERQFDLLSALDDVHWAPKDPFTDASRIWRDYIRDLMEKGAVHRAQAVVNNIRQPYVIVTMRTEQVFDPLVQAAPERFAVEAAMSRYLDSLRTTMSANPSSLTGVNRLAIGLLWDGRPEEALKLTDDALLKALPKNGSKSSFVDAEDDVIWTMDARSRALQLLGRSEEAAAQLERAARRPEDGRVNVSQAINLGQLYARMGRPKDAIAAVADVSPRNVSTYGLLAAEEARAMAYAQTGDEAALAKSIALARSNFDDLPDFLADMLLFANDLDGTAKVYIDGLSDPDRQGTVLLFLQDYRKHPPLSAFDGELERRLDAVRNRPDVRAAVAKVGRIETIPLYLEDG